MYLVLIDQLMNGTFDRLIDGWIERWIYELMDRLKGRPFDSEGGGLALFGNKYSDLKNAGNK